MGIFDFIKSCFKQQVINNAKSLNNGIIEFEYDIKDLKNGKITIDDIVKQTNLSIEQIKQILTPQLNEQGYEFNGNNVVKKVSIDILEMVKDSDVPGMMMETLINKNGLSVEQAKKYVAQVFANIKTDENGQIPTNDEGEIKRRNLENRKNKASEYYDNLIKVYIYQIELNNFSNISLDDMPLGNAEMMAYYFYLINITRKLYKFRDIPDVANFLLAACDRIIDNLDLFISNMVDYDVEIEQCRCFTRNIPFDFVKVYKEKTERNQINPDQFIQTKKRLEYLISKQ